MHYGDPSLTRQMRLRALLPKVESSICARRQADKRLETAL